MRIRTYFLKRSFVISGYLKIHNAWVFVIVILEEHHNLPTLDANANITEGTNSYQRFATTAGL
jgi:hypothetical protein